MNLRTSATREALARAVIARALALGFQIPTARLLDQVFSREGSGVILEASAVLDRESTGPAVSAAERIAGIHATLPAIRSKYETLFGHTARGRVCPYETEYGPGQGPFLQSQMLANLSGFYRAFGLVVRAGRGERVDHIAVEWEFAGFLSEKEAYGLEAEDDEMCKSTRRAYRAFLRDHLSTFGRAFAAGLSKNDPEGEYGALAALCEAFLLLECERFTLAPGPRYLALRSDSLEDAPLACGSDDSLVNLEGV